MELKLNVSGCFCAADEFIINGIDADSDDFGEQGDESSYTAEEYCCGDMKFTRNDSTPEVLAKYKINQEEYDAICDKLTEGLSFGACGLCS